jgi:hypothetical protein
LQQRRVGVNFGMSWSIDTTTKSVISIGTRILTTALSDNVQALTILACASYGATIPMSSEVCLKIEKLAKRKHISHVVHHLGTSIGFAPGDSADQLASSDAGGTTSTLSTWNHQVR